MNLGIFAQRRTPADGGAFELEDAVGNKAAGPPLGILRIDRMAVTRTELLDRELLEPLIVHGRLLASVLTPAIWARQLGIRRPHLGAIGRPRPDLAVGRYARFACLGWS